MKISDHIVFVLRNVESSVFKYEFLTMTSEMASRKKEKTSRRNTEEVTGNR